ncbi:hypothetical protein [Streptomyces sp. NPDC002403]
MSSTEAVAFWDGVYAGRPAAGNPQPNARLTETVTGLAPGGPGRLPAQLVEKAIHRQLNVEKSGSGNARQP